MCTSTCLDLYSVQFGGELVVNCKYMAVLNLLRFGLLGEHTLSGLPTGQRLQRSHQLSLRDVRLLLDLLQRQGKKKVRPLGPCVRKLLSSLMCPSSLSSV